MATLRSPDVEEVRTAEIIATLSLATDLGVGLPLEHGLGATLLALRLARRAGVGVRTTRQAYYGCLLFYVGCTADAELSAGLFPDGALLAHFTPVMFGRPSETMIGIARALARPERSLPVRAAQVAAGLPPALLGHRQHMVALCQVAQMLSSRLGMPDSVVGLFPSLTERWDGRGEPGESRGAQIPMALRIIHVARDAAFQCLLGGPEHAARVLRERAGYAFDPELAHALADDKGLLAVEEPDAWGQVMALEPQPPLMLRGPEIDDALHAMADFTDLLSPYLIGHSSGLAALVAVAAERRSLPQAEVSAIQRAAWVHDLGRVAVPAGIWQKAGALSADEWEQVRLHAYHSERLLRRSDFLAPLAAIAVGHHERLDGSGYHRGISAVDLAPAARLLAAADAYQTKIEPRPHRPAASPQQAAEFLGREVTTGRLDHDSVAAVLGAAGHRPQALARPAGLTAREAEVIGLVARGLATKQVARKLGIAVKTADHHLQNAYAKIGVSTRAAAAVFAMQHGLVGWGEVPMVSRRIGS